MGSTSNISGKDDKTVPKKECQMCKVDRHPRCLTCTHKHMVRKCPNGHMYIYGLNAKGCYHCIYGTNYRSYSSYKTTMKRW